MEQNESGANMAGAKISEQALKKALKIKTAKAGSAKTMFRMPESAFALINTMNKILGESTKGTLDKLTKILEEKPVILKRCEIPEDAIRKSVSINAVAKNRLSHFARENGWSRDEVLYSLIKNLVDDVNHRDLTKEEKIKYARVLEKMASDILDIYESPEVAEAKSKLIACDDPDFGGGFGTDSCASILEHVETIYELQDKIEEFIGKKEKDS